MSEQILSLSKPFSLDEISKFLSDTDGQDKTQRFELIDIAKALNVTTDAVRDLVRKRKIGHYRCGKRIAISQLQFAEYRLSLPKEVEVKPIRAKQEQSFTSPETERTNLDPPLAMTVPEAANRLRVSAGTIRRLVDERKMGHVRIGKRILITPSAIEDFLSRNYHPPFDAAAEARKILEGRVSIGRRKK